MPSPSRYLATVRRAMVRPCPRRTWAISWSDSGLPASSAATRSRMFFLTETEETISPESEAMPLWKKYLSSNSPWGVSTYLLVVTRLMVDSQARNPLLVEHHHVVVANLVDGDVGRDVPLLGGGEAAARLGLEPLDLLHRLHDPIEGELERPRDVRVAAALEVLEVLLHDLHGDGIGLGVGGELEEETLLDAPRGHPRGVEGLD